MAEATRRRAIYQVQNVLQAYKDKIEYARTYFDNLTKEGQDLVLDYTKENSEIKDLLTNAIKEYAFFYCMDNSDLIEYTKVCKKLNTVFNLNINNVENISKIIDDNFYITSDAQRITSFTEVELGRAVTYNVGDGYGIDANTKQNQTIYDVEWEVEDVDGNFDEATSKREKRLINIVNFANNAATDWPIISKFSEANPFEIQLKATELGEYKIRAKIYKDYGVTKTLCDVIEFNQLVTEVDEKIASLSTWEKLKKALSMVQWKQEIDIDMLVQSLIDSLPMICFMSALILTFGDVAAALLALMSLADGSKDLFDGFVKTAEGFEIVKNAGSNNALKHGGEVIYEGLNIFGLGTIEIFLSKCTMKNVQTAKMQLAKSGAKALSTASTKGLPATVQSGIASSEVATLPAIKEISEIQLSKAMADSAKKSSDLLADVAVSKNEKALLEEIANDITVENIEIDITPYYKECGRIVERTYTNSKAVAVTYSNGEKVKLLKILEKQALSEELQAQINNIPLGKRGDYRVPMPEKIKGIKIDKDGSARIVEAWRDNCDGAKDGTREMALIKQGTLLDRVGGESGNYFSPMKPDGTPYSLKERAIGDYLPEADITKNDSYHLYRTTMDFTSENFKKQIEMKFYKNIDKKNDLLNNLKRYYMDSKSKVHTDKHDGEAYFKGKFENGIKSGEIDKMFLEDDGGALQYITPFNVEILKKLEMLEVLK